MIAVVTSCIYPVATIDNEKRSHVSLSEREQQTIQSIAELVKKGFSKIIIVDNAAVAYDFSTIKALAPHIEVVQLKQYQFQNKGINELLMLLAIVDELPENEVIFKLSARYCPNEHFSKKFDPNCDFKVKGYDFDQKRGTISTRAYFVKNKAVYKDFLLKTLNEVFLYPQRIVGLRSLANLFSSIFKPSFAPRFNTSIEFAAARVLKHEKYSIKLVDSIGIEGIVAGSDLNSQIIE
ncbi:hypothetical protein VRU48_08490 [Pedobacter sp. KR3-3]|uniref:Uncharacterized protein n=1 Tax=Pedobacter albus TaxID=3113905 RepID=A0ABU7I6R7_9SPHI|nr:hypothetical protein [Pedobacter sp. KR3-3]MEE1945143.1 hypothetical protein [Pedobacter sp. KR3-3]